MFVTLVILGTMTAEGKEDDLPCSVLNNKLIYFNLILSKLTDALIYIFRLSKLFSFYYYHLISAF